MLEVILWSWTYTSTASINWVSWTHVHVCIDATYLTYIILYMREKTAESSECGWIFIVHFSLQKLEGGFWQKTDVGVSDNNMSMVTNEWRSYHTGVASTSTVGKGRQSSAERCASNPQHSWDYNLTLNNWHWQKDDGEKITVCSQVQLRWCYVTLVLDIFSIWSTVEQRVLVSEERIIGRRSISFQMMSH